MYQSPLLNEFPKVPGIYTLGGGRQIGKSTLLKQWMLRLLEAKVDPKRILFISGELINDHHALYNILFQVLEAGGKETKASFQYLLIDEVTYIKDWDKAVKYAADLGLLENTILMLTGSELSLIQEARMRFPGRRGKSDVTNFHLYPLSFKESVLLKHPEFKGSDKVKIDILFEEFNQYLLHGGFLTAINEYALTNSISVATLTTYSEWIRGDMVKRGKQEHYLKEIVSAIIKRYTSQITWNALSKDLSIDHPKTVADYAAHLVNMDTLIVQSALIEDKLTLAPKKGKKIIFTDPFIYHALRAWLYPEKDPFTMQMMPAVMDSIESSKLVET